MQPLSPRILVIDDDSLNCELIKLMLQFSNPHYEITCALTSEEGLSLASSQGFDLYLLDYRLRGMTGIEVCRTLRQTHADTPIMFFTGETHDHKRQEAVQAGADAYLIKPNDLKNLTETVKQLLGMDKPATRRKIPLRAYGSEASV
jgi:CheY-like chemotaxis protein